MLWTNNLRYREVKNCAQSSQLESVREDSNPGAPIINHNTLDQHYPNHSVMTEAFCVRNGSRWPQVPYRTVVSMSIYILYYIILLHYISIAIYTYIWYIKG